MATQGTPLIESVRFEHYLPENAIGVHETKPRISWKFTNVPKGFQQQGYEIELSDHISDSDIRLLSSAKVTSLQTTLNPWPYDKPLLSRQKVSVRVRAWGDDGQITQWSSPTHLETGLLSREDWKCQRIASPWEKDEDKPQPEELFRKEFSVEASVSSARLYITAQGVYEAELNGQRVGEYFLAPGWTTYTDRLQYQTYDVTKLLNGTKNCLGVRIAEGWFSGRFGFNGGKRNIWGSQNTVIAQLEIKYSNGHSETICTDDSWIATSGPAKLAELYDGEKYDANAEITDWSSAAITLTDAWQKVAVLPFLSETIDLTSGCAEPVRRIKTLKPIEQITTPTGKTILDFGQNLVGYIRIKNVIGSKGQKITLRHAEVLENGELGIRPLRDCKATDEYTLKGSENGEQWEPRFTFHGFRYAEVEGWPSVSQPLMENLEAVVCYTDMEPAGEFSCSDSMLNKLFENVCWSLRDNFLSVPTDCPQRDERLGWTGDLALFAPTACLIYDCFGMLKNWLVDVAYDQKQQNGIPPMVTPNILQGHVVFGDFPTAIWHDVTVLAPWALYEATGDASILKDQYHSMTWWLDSIPRNKGSLTHLWDENTFQLGDWLDPNASPHEPWKAATNAILVSNAFLIQSLDLMVRTAEIVGNSADAKRFREEADAARAEFSEEYVSPNGRMVSDTQTAYSLAICFNLLTPTQKTRAGNRLAEIVRRNHFKIATGFAGTPYVCEALVQTGHAQVAYSMLLNQKCPSWLYPVSMGATTTWERWDSMLPDGSINPGEMTSFNHYAFGAVARFLYERVAGLQSLEPGWKKSRVEPLLGAEFTHASASHLTPYGKVACSWKLENSSNASESSPVTTTLTVQVTVPPNTTMEVVLPHADGGSKTETVGSGDWSFTVPYVKSYEWPIQPIKNLPPGVPEPV